MSVVISKLSFAEDSHFTAGTDVGISTANAADGNRYSVSFTSRL